MLYDMYVCMDGWMDGWMDACIDACMDGCMHGWMHGCMDAWMHVCMYACMHVCMFMHAYISVEIIYRHIMTRFEMHKYAVEVVFEQWCSMRQGHHGTMAQRLQPVPSQDHLKICLWLQNVAKLDSAGQLPFQIFKPVVLQRCLPFSSQSRTRHHGPNQISKELKLPTRGPILLISKTAWLSVINRGEMWWVANLYALLLEGGEASHLGATINDFLQSTEPWRVMHGDPGPVFCNKVMRGLTVRTSLTDAAHWLQIRSPPCQVRHWTQRGPKHIRTACQHGVPISTQSFKPHKWYMRNKYKDLQRSTN